jgi:putative (di)nucleoside polyphosphate hydrolase
MIPYQKRPYRPGVGIMLLDAIGRVLVAQRLDMPSDAWQMPQGGIDKDEKPLEAARREMREEIGTDKAVLEAKGRGWHHYDLPPDLADRIWKGRFRGQRQKWFAFRFQGRDQDIDIATQHPEFSRWKWAEMAELPDLIVPFKRQLYSALVEEFGHLAKKA